VIDVDGLGAVNESRGHAAGDALLLEVGNRIEAQARGSDAFAHLGDDAFGVLMPATTIDRSLPLIDRLLDTLRSTPVVHGADRLEATVSLGLAELDPAGLPLGVDRKSVADQWLADAEAAMHRAKRAGGDGYAMSGR
jgi:diguanylate cyclase (GGDEF)-like protein